ncbi:unnamed protein product [Ambrosiozyma monospora]|uniref:Unnamed protein product n=1 Tax=Ambrosiozyma monospora TaxID=43982 RepID=A0ACB5THE2_AMBMO|nr:unnamed protein product [Ambrosiozyma monospora]
MPHSGSTNSSSGINSSKNYNDWIKVFDENEKEWMPTVISMMRSFTERLPQSYIEVEECTVRLHTESCTDIEKQHKLKLVGDLIAHINELYAKDFHLHANLVNGVVIVQEAHLIHRALTYILNNPPEKQTLEHFDIGDLTFNEMNHSNSSVIKLNDSGVPFDFLFYAGGDTPTDEDVFKSFGGIKKEVNDNLISVKVGRSRANSKAGEKLKGINELLNILSRAGTTTQANSSLVVNHSAEV